MNGCLDDTHRVSNVEVGNSFATVSCSALVDVNAVSMVRTGWNAWTWKERGRCGVKY